MNASSVDRDERPGRRPYRSPVRDERAAATRRRIVESAAALFEKRGYRATRLSDVAAASGVSLPTVHLNGPKPALLLAALELRSTGGEGFSSIFESPVGPTSTPDLADAETAVRWVARFAVESNARVNGIWAALEHAASEDQEVAEVLDRLTERMRADAQKGVRLVLKGSAPHQKRELERRGDLLWTLTSPDVYRRLVLQAGWTAAEYRGWLERALSEALRRDER